MKIVKSLVVTLMLLMVVLVAGCGQVFSHVHIDKDLGGTWKTKIFANQPMTKEQLENRLSQSNIMKYTIDPITEELTVDGVKKNVNGWEVSTTWKSEQEFANIINAIGDGLTFMQHVNTPFNKLDKDNSNLITLDMGMSTDRVTVHIEGMIVKETVKGKIIDSNTVEFTKGQAVKFQFIPGIFVMGVNVKNIMGGGVLLAIGCGAFVFYRRRNDKKREVA